MKGIKGAHALKHNLQGKIVGDRYYSYGNSFSIQLPSTSDATQVEDSFVSPHIGGVAFYNDSGFLLKIEIDELIPEVTSMISKYPEIKEEMLDALFKDALMVQIKQSVPKVELLYEKMIKLGNGEPVFFVVLNLPEAATLVNMSTGRGLDSKRGYLMFFANDKDMVTMSLQDTLSFIPSVAEAAKSSLSDRLLNHLLHYQETFRVEAGAFSGKPNFSNPNPMP